MLACVICNWDISTVFMNFQEYQCVGEFFWCSVGSVGMCSRRASAQHWLLQELLGLQPVLGSGHCTFFTAKGIVISFYNDKTYIWDFPFIFLFSECQPRSCLAIASEFICC